jgi:hypothetical protein
MIDTSVIRPECLYESAEAAELCGRSDVKSFIAAIQRAGHKPSHKGRCMLWQGTTLLMFLGVEDRWPQVPDISQEEARRRLKALRPNARKKAIA